MVIVHCSLTVDDFIDGKTLPTVDHLRPSSCPSCGQPGHGLGQSPTLVGHGSHVRHVRGASDRRDVVSIRVRRFRCLRCGATTTVLPSQVYPRRHYSAPAILASLVRVVLQRQSTNSAREQLDGIRADGPWRSPLRWKRELLGPLWSWDAAQLGFQVGPTDDPDQQRVRLFRLLSLYGVGPDPTDADLSVASAAMLRGLSRTRVRPGSAMTRSPRVSRRAHPHGLSSSGTEQVATALAGRIPVAAPESLPEQDCSNSRTGHGAIEREAGVRVCCGRVRPLRAREPSTTHPRAGRAAPGAARKPNQPLIRTSPSRPSDAAGSGRTKGRFPSGP